MKEYEFDYIISIRGTGNMYADSKDEVIDELNSTDLVKEIKGDMIHSNNIDFYVEKLNVEDITNVREI